MLSVGLVGLPNAGKSTFFNLITKRAVPVPAANFPFTTIDPHDGIVEVPDRRLATLAKLANSKKIVPANIEFRDIAGLIKNAHKGEGLGNQFLSHIQEVDLILMIIRCFKNDDVIHVENRVNPFEDKEILMLELTLADEKKLEGVILRLEKDRNVDNKAAKLELAERIMTKLSQLLPAKSENNDNWDDDVIAWRKSLNLLTDKPMLTLANITYEGDNEVFPADFSMDIYLESQFADLDPSEREELGASKETAIDQVINSSYSALNLATYLTCGEMETRAWTFTRGMKAPACAGKIHSDFEKKFIRAEVVTYEEFIKAGSWKNAYDLGVVRSMGKDYYMEDGNVVEFKVNP